jgi:hypothetical protein
MVHSFREPRAKTSLRDGTPVSAQEPRWSRGPKTANRPARIPRPDKGLERNHAIRHKAISSWVLQQPAPRFALRRLLVAPGNCYRSRTPERCPARKVGSLVQSWGSAPPDDCYPLRFGVPRTWTSGGNITLSNCCVNMAAPKNATARNVSLPVLARSCRTGVGTTKTLQGPTACLVPSSRRSSPVPERMYCVSSVASVCQPSRPPGSTHKRSSKIASFHVRHRRQRRRPIAPTGHPLRQRSPAEDCRS